MGLEDKFGKVPLRRIFRRFFEALFDPENGHDHDGVNSKTLSPAAVVANGSVTTVKIVDEAVTADKIAANAVTTEKIEDEAVTAANSTQTWPAIASGSTRPRARSTSRSTT